MIMVELIVTIFAGLGFCASVHFVIGLIEKLDKNAKKEIEQTDDKHYWYIVCSFKNGNGSMFISTFTEIFNIKEVEDEIKKDIHCESKVIINNFIEVTKEFYEANYGKLKDK